MNFRREDLAFGEPRHRGEVSDEVELHSPQVRYVMMYRPRRHCDPLVGRKRLSSVFYHPSGIL